MKNELKEIIVRFKIGALTQKEAKEKIEAIIEEEKKHFQVDYWEYKILEEK